MAAEPTALVVMISAHGGPAKMRALWRVSVADARKICSDPRTALRNSALHYLLSAAPEGEYRGPGETLPDEHRGDTWEFVADNGRWDSLLAELEVTVLESRAQPRRQEVAA